MQITQCKHPKGGVDIIILSKFNTPKNIIIKVQKYGDAFSESSSILSNVHKREGAYLQCVNNHYAEFEYKVMKTIGVQITKDRHPQAFQMKKMSYQFNTPQKKRKYLSIMHKIVFAHLQCVNNHYAKFEYKGMLSGAVTKYTN